MAQGDVTVNISKPSGKGLYFNGANGNVTIPDAPALNITKAITLIAWVKQDSGQGANWTKQFTKGDDKTFTLASCRGAAKTADFRMWIGAAEKSVVAGDIYDDVWHLLIGTYDGETQSIYLDGTLANSAAVTGLIDTDAANLFIGGSNNFANMFKGVLQVVRIYSRAITADEVTKLYAGKPINTKDLVCCYSFNDTTDTGHDDTGHGHDGTPGGGILCVGGHNTTEDDVIEARATASDKYGFIPLANGKEIMTVHIEEA